MDKTARARRRRTPEQTLHARIREAVSSLLSPSDSDNSSFYERRSPPSFPRRREFSDLKFPGRQPRNPWVFPENQPCHSYNDAPAAYSYTHFGSSYRVCHPLREISGVLPNPAEERRCHLVQP